MKLPRMALSHEQNEQKRTNHTYIRTLPSYSNGTAIKIDFKAMIETKRANVRGAGIEIKATQNHEISFQ